MKQNAGLWIDHKKAVVVSVTGAEQEDVKIIHYDIKKSYRENSSAKADDIRQRELTGHLDAYYDRVIAFVGGADSILLFGPGEAKGELKKRFERDKLGNRLAAVETADKMTDPQIVAKVKDYFLHRAPVNE